jgi:hypothetical protein
MDDTIAGSHPLHVAGCDGATVAGTVLVLELAVQHVGDRLETTVRMVWRTNRFARPIVDRTHFIEQQERVDVIEPCAWERPADQKSASLTQTLGMNDSLDFARSHDRGTSKAKGEKCGQNL